MNTENKLFLLIGPPEAGKTNVAQTLAEAYADRIELIPRLTDKPSELIPLNAGHVRSVTPHTLRRRIQDGRLILTREGEHVSGFDPARLDRVLKKKHAILVTDENGVVQLKEKLDENGLPKYQTFVIRVCLPRRHLNGASPPSEVVSADIEILMGLEPDPIRRVVVEIRSHFPQLFG